MAYISKWKLKNGTVVPVGSNLFGHCGTASGTQTKVVTLADFDVLVEGITVHVHFQYKNTANGALLQVGNTVAKAIRYNGTSNGDWADDSIVSFTYYGDMWNQNDYQSGGGGTSQEYPYIYNADYDPDYMEIDVSKKTGVGTSENYSIVIKGVGYIERDGDDLKIHNYRPTGHNTGASSVQTIPLGTADTDTTYTISISGHTITLTGSDGSTDSITVPDDDTTYTMSISGHTITLTPSLGTAQTITVPDDDTTYSLSISGDVLTLTGSDGSTDSVTIPDDDTTYTLSINNHSIELVGSDSTTSTVVLPIYALSGDDAQATLTDSYGNTSVAVYPTYTIYKNYDEIVLARDYGGLQTEVARVTDDNTTYGLQFINGTLTLVASGGTASVSIPDTNTTYSLSLSGSTLTLTGSDGSTSSVTISGGNIVDVQVDGTSVVDQQGIADITPSSLIDIFYPVGSYYETSDTSFDPNVSWGGTWSLETEGLVHIGAGSNYIVGATGGEVAHTLTKAESGLPSHGHGFTRPTVKTGEGGHTHTVTVHYRNAVPTTGSSAQPWAAGTLTSTGTATIASNTGTHSHTLQGGSVSDNSGANASSAHNNMQPYVVVNRWHRTA